MDFIIKSEDLDELDLLWKFQEISMFSLWDIWDQSFHDIPYMVSLCPYKEMAETSNSNLSKTTHRNSQNIFRDDFSSENL